MQTPDTMIAGGSTAQDDWAVSLTDLEAKADVLSLAELHHERRELIKNNAALMARYGSFGMHDDYRKQRVEALKVKARMDLSAGQEKKPTESAIDAAAYGSDAYAAFLDNALDEKVAYLDVQNRIDEINEQIRSREIAIMAFSAELRLTR